MKLGFILDIMKKSLGGTTSEIFINRCKTPNISTIITRLGVSWVSNEVKTFKQVYFKGLVCCFFLAKLNKLFKNTQYFLADLDYICRFSDFIIFWLKNSSLNFFASLNDLEYPRHPQGWNNTSVK